MLKLVPAGERVVALDVQGKRVSTEELARQLGCWQKELDHLFRTLTLDYNPVPLEQLIQQPVMRLIN